MTADERGGEGSLEFIEPYGGEGGNRVNFLVTQPKKRDATESPSPLPPTLRRSIMTDLLYTHFTVAMKQ